MYKLLLKPFLFAYSPEKAHHLTFKLLRISLVIPILGWLLKLTYSTKDKTVEIQGLKFRNKVGLAAGLDKNAEFLYELKALGFGFVEVGTVTPLAQDGNPTPRLFRLPKDEALINRMGFNNHGVDAMVERLKKRPKGLIVGGNIGKNKLTPNENAVEDYKICFEKLYPYVDYFVVNVSSPNTPNLRELQNKEPLFNILNTLIQHPANTGKPLFLKIAPDVDDAFLQTIVEVAIEAKITGLVISNTTIERAGLKTSNNEVEAIGNGGLSGKPVLQASNEVLRKAKSMAEDKLKFIGVGGIHDLDSGSQKITAGADLIQIYSGLIYEGPSLIKKLSKL